MRTVKAFFQGVWKYPGLSGNRDGNYGFSHGSEAVAFNTIGEHDCILAVSFPMRRFLPFSEYAAPPSNIDLIFQIGDH